MFRNLVACFGAVLSCVLSTPAQAEIAANPHPYVRQVICLEGRGTAVRISRDRYLSVDHVTSMNRCSIDGVPIEVIEGNGDLDFSILKAPPMAGAVKIDCGGFQYGRFYHAFGYAFGAPQQWHTPLYLLSPDRGPFGMAILVGPGGTVIPGMSGGGLFDHETGALVGMVNMYSPFFGHSISRSLQDTSICRDSAQA
jgi:hypothetical protein